MASNHQVVEFLEEEAIKTSQSQAPKDNSSSAEEPKVAILGTGDFGRSLASRLTRNGYSVVMGSRYPHHRDLASRDPQLAQLPVMSLDLAVDEAEILLVAVPAQHMLDTLQPLHKALTGKILVDVSNNGGFLDGSSHAEQIAEAFPGAQVVKAFNTLSAYALSSGHASGNMEVQIASDSPYAREVISGLARDIGLKVAIFGGLRSARELERIPLRLWKGWGMPVLVVVITWLTWGVYGTWRYHGLKKREWSRWPTNTNNKIMATTAVTLLAFCYLPGCLAAAAQLIFGTKHRAFPAWLNAWMGMRKQLGLLALWLAGVHCVLSVAHLTPAYFSKWYDTTTVTIPVNLTDSIEIPIDVRMNWIGESTVCLGTLSLGLMVMLGISSLPSVGSTMNWRQWTFLQSYIGHVCLLLATAHVSMKVMPYVFWQPFLVTVQGMGFLSFLLPSFTLLFRLVLVLPCLGIPLQHIRGGWERKPRDGITDSQGSGSRSNPKGSRSTQHAYWNRGCECSEGPRLKASDSTVWEDCM